MSEPDHIPILSSDDDEESSSDVAGSSDSEYGYTLPGCRAAQVCVVSMVIACVVLVALFLPFARSAVIPLCVSLIPLFAVALAAAIPLAAAGKSDVPTAPLIAGWAVVLGGAACDIYATVSHSPDLAREANPVLRGLLDNGVSLQQVYLYAAAGQVFFIALSMVLWLGLLKHRHTLAATMPSRGSLLAYFKAGTGGRELSYRQWCCPLTYSELPWAYHFAWWMGVAFVGTSVYRFYLAAEWFGLAPLSPLGVRFIAPSVILFSMSWSYAVWLREARENLDS